MSAHPALRGILDYLADADHVRRLRLGGHTHLVAALAEWDAVGRPLLWTAPLCACGCGQAPGRNSARMPRVYVPGHRPPPARVRVLDALTRRQKARAATIARDLGVPVSVVTGALQYHRAAGRVRLLAGRRWEMVA